jgi:CelD/BcsL family acetyltransferase involved in cellulose biosynthesis
MQFELVNSIERLQSLYIDWDDLESRSNGHVFQSFEFVTSWLATAGKAASVQPCVVIYRENNRVYGIAPFCIHPYGFLKLITWLGGFQIVDYGDVLFDNSALLSCDKFVEQAINLVRQLKPYYLFYLHNVRKDALIFPYLLKHYIIKSSDVAPAFKIDGEFETFIVSLRKFRKKLKSDTLRQERRLSELGKLSFKIINRNDDNLESVITAFIEQKKRQYLSSSINGVLFKPGYFEFYMNISQLDSASHISALSLNNKVIAAHIGYLYRNTFYYLMPSYDIEFEKYSPGRVLMYRLVHECFSNQVDVFDFGRGSEQYKYEWTDKEESLFSFVSPSLLGVLFTRAWQIRQRIRGS